MTKLLALVALVVALIAPVSAGAQDEYFSYIPTVSTGNIVSIRVTHQKCGAVLGNVPAGVDFFDSEPSINGRTDQSGVFAATGTNNSALIYVFDVFSFAHIGWAGPVMNVVIEYCGGVTEVTWPFPDGK